MSSPVVFLTHEFYPRPGGIGTYVRGLAEAVQAAAGAAEVWAPRAPGVAERPWPFRVVRMPVRGTQGWIDRWRLLLYLRKSRPDWSQATLCLAEPGPLRLWMAGPPGLPRVGRLVVVLHGTEIHRFAAVPRWRTRFQRILREAAAVGVVSEYTRSQLEAIDPRVAATARLVPGAPDTRRFLPSASRPAKPDLVALAVGRLHPAKGQLDIVRALATLPVAERSRWILRCVGRTARPPYARQMTQEAKAAGVRLEMLGAAADDELPQHLAAADVFVQASRRVAHTTEGLGLAVLEASASGLPVVASRHGGLPEAVKDNQTGLLVEPGQPEALAQALRRLAEDAGLREALGRGGAAWARSGFSWERNRALLFDAPHG